MAFSVDPKDLLLLLDRIPLWKRISAMPARLDELEKRLAALEQKPNLPICEACGVGYKRLDRVEKPSGAFAVFDGSGLQFRIFKCDHCGMETKERGGA